MTNDVDALPLFQGVMPKTSVIASDARGGLAARAPSPGVELLTKDGVRLALFSRPPRALRRGARGRVRAHPGRAPRRSGARANALRAWLKSMHDAKRLFLALFDGSNRVFAAWTRSAPMSFGHARTGRRLWWRASARARWWVPMSSTPV